MEREDAAGLALAMNPCMPVVEIQRPLHIELVCCTVWYSGGRAAVARQKERMLGPRLPGPSVAYLHRKHVTSSYIQNATIYRSRVAERAAHRICVGW